MRDHPAIQIAFDQLKADLGRKEGQLELLQQQVSIASAEAEQLHARRLDLKKEVELLDAFQTFKNNDIKQKFEAVINEALTFVFGQGFSFELEFSKRGNVPECRLNIKTPELAQAFDPLLTEAGTVLDIVSLAIRVAVMELSRPRYEGVITLDEPFKHVSAEYLERANEFLAVVIRRLGRQVIMSTHHQAHIDLAETKILIGGGRDE